MVLVSLEVGHGSAIVEDPFAVDAVYSRLVAADALVGSYLNLTVRAPANQDGSVRRLEPEDLRHSGASDELQDQVGVALLRRQVPLLEVVRQLHTLILVVECLSLVH